MTSRLTLISPAISASLRQARFDDGSSLDDGGAARARAAAGSLPTAARVRVSPSVRCRETASALGLDASAAQERSEPSELSGLNVGRWTGRTLDEVGAAEPDAVARWLADPGAAPHGGESVRDLCERVTRWLDDCGGTDGRTLAVVEPEVVRAAVLHVLGAPETAFWRLDVPPLAATELTGRSGRWNLRLGRALAAEAEPATEA
ncbi:histidine phosphatase family protein [Streptomyces sp. S186]|uniref:histidine phosphatase family protein n=1 Tax=Streptomyces sp. S186 TaxID=3434395 RepID=UPI003F672A2A